MIVRFIDEINVISPVLLSSALNKKQTKHLNGSAYNFLKEAGDKKYSVSYL